MESCNHSSEIEPKLFCVLKRNYSLKDLSSDAVAGLVVAIIALPLSMAFAIASGVGPEKGLYTAIVGGFIISALGGSRFQIGGPAGAFVVVLYDIVSRQGFDGLVIASMLGGLIMITLGLLRLGAIIKFIPYPVTKGFTAGIAMIIFFSQINDFLGLGIAKLDSEFIGKAVQYSKNIAKIDITTLSIGIASLIIILYSKKVTKLLPGPFLAVVFGIVLVMLFDMPVATIESKFGSIPHMLPSPSFPEITLSRIRGLIPDAITIGLLGAIESLMSAVVADGLTGDKHRSNVELLAQGTANISTALFGGIPVTGTTARTVTNINAGAKSPLSGIFHSLWLALFMILFAPIIVKIPFATLAAILIVVAYNMSEINHIKNLLSSPKSDISVFIITFALTVIIDLTVAVQVGMLLASLLFIRRITMMTEIKDIAPSIQKLAGENFDEFDPDATSNKTIPERVQVYEINGPFFFGVAERFKNTFDTISEKPRGFIIRMRHVPFIDATGTHALEEFCKTCISKNIPVVLSGVNEHVKNNLLKGSIDKVIGIENITNHIDIALKRMEYLLDSNNE